MNDAKQTFGHVPVLLKETLEMLVPANPDCLMVDGTLGLAGHSSAFLARYPALRLIGVDADSEVQAIARARLSAYGDRVTLVNSFFDTFFMDLAGWLSGSGLEERPALVLFDFGVSMFHFRESGRGFSLQGDEALDMRLNPSTGRSAADLVNDLDERELGKILAEYGEEPFAFRIARAVVRERRAARIDSTARLADIVRGTVPPQLRYGRTHAATRTFQALRIAVNDELGRIERGLSAAIDCLAPNGMVACISFHSLEDRIVKQTFRSRSVRRPSSKYPSTGVGFMDGMESPIGVGGTERGLVVLTRKPVEPSLDEVSANPASRSARLRVARVIGDQG
jgi:16S rRNA (cytosine1402-N4)-methyltransferase